jgi:hypothetical protein
LSQLPFIEFNTRDSGLRLLERTAKETSQVKQSRDYGRQFPDELCARSRRRGSRGGCRIFHRFLPVCLGRSRGPSRGGIEAECRTNCASQHEFPVSKRRASYSSSLNFLKGNLIAHSAMHRERDYLGLPIHICLHCNRLAVAGYSSNPLTARRPHAQGAVFGCVN